MSEFLDVTNSQSALVDKRDFVRASTHTWWRDGKFPVSVIDGNKTSLGSYVLGCSDKERAYYKNGDRFDCTRGNLTKKRGETEEGMPIAKVREVLLAEILRHKELVNKSEMWSGIENPTSEKLRSRITRAEAVLAGGDKMEMIKITRILKKVR